MFQARTQSARAGAALSPRLIAVLALLVQNVGANQVDQTQKSTSKVIKLTEQNFDTEVARGAYFVKVYAEWCLHCRHMAPTWEGLAKDLDGEIFVGEIDGPSEKGLVSRLGVQGFPAIFLLRDGRTYEYTGSRGLEQMARFGRKDWKTAKPMPYYKAPNSVPGRVFGLVSSFLVVFENMYNDLRSEKEFSDLNIIGLMLVIPATVGLALICCLDAFTVRQAPRNNVLLRPHVE
jgi:thiol-disulfide isomerase/thioredoxin